MFTGIIQDLGTVIDLQTFDRADASDVRISIECATLDAKSLALGDSVCVSGVCLTVMEQSSRGFAADASAETLACTTLGSLEPGSRVNLEPALTPSTPLGGHLVSGHVDGVAALLSRHAEGRSERMRFSVPADLARYVAAKGSLCVDGISLTVNDVDATSFGVNIIPHTLQVTTLGGFEPGQPVNLEVDQVARYLERLLEGRE